MHNETLRVNLSLFDGEGGEGSTGESANVSYAAGKKSGEYSNVKFGIQENAEQEGAADLSSDSNVTSNTLEERRKAYHDLINSDEYKELYTEDTQKMINRRFKETKNLEKQVAEVKPLLDLLYQRYGANDVESVTKAIESDDAYWENAAYDAGMTVEQYKRVQKLERENRALIEAQNAMHQSQMVDQQVNTWVSEAEQMKDQYPDFDLNTELLDEQFTRLITNGVPLRHAYEVLHMDEIKQNITKSTADMTTRNVVENIRAKGSRPLENGISSQGAFTVKSDVTKLTKKDREEIVRRTARGERIAF